MWGKWAVSSKQKFLSWRTSLPCIVVELVGGESVGVDVAVAVALAAAVAVALPVAVAVAKAVAVGVDPLVTKLCQSIS